MQYFKQLISHNTIQKVFDLYHNSTNRVEIDTKLVDRHAPSAIGHFMLSKFTNEEFDFLWEEVKHELVEYDLVYARVLKYNKGCFIQPHTDSYNQGQQESDYSCIVQLNDPSTYRGGLPSIDTRLFYLEQGDALVYSYDETHGVEPVQKGIRYVVNLRLKKVK